MRAYTTMKAGRQGWGVRMRAMPTTRHTQAGVEIGLIGPYGGTYRGDRMSPDQADELALELVRQAQVARDLPAVLPPRINRGRPSHLREAS